MRLAVVIAAALALAAPAAAAPPGAGVLVPGRSLGGIELGATKAQVERSWGRAYGVCRGCPNETWYFNYFAFQPRGAGVELRDGRVVAVFTLYQPPGWRTTRGLTLGDSVARVTAVYGALVRRECGGYAVLVLPGRQATTAFYVLDDTLWAFGLARPGVPLCR
ncbi:MAG TPA: hypothetical protein VFV62_09475 [Gaiellaceae bacterium]|nr:hypothetical protein [Gaiellaceae bacterium]